MTTHFFLRLHSKQNVPRNGHSLPGMLETESLSAQTRDITHGLCVWGQRCSWLLLKCPQGNHSSPQKYRTFPTESGEPVTVCCIFDFDDVGRGYTKWGLWVPRPPDFLRATQLWWAFSFRPMKRTPHCAFTSVLFLTYTSIRELIYIVYAKKVVAVFKVQQEKTSITRVRIFGLKSSSFVILATFGEERDLKNLKSCCTSKGLGGERLKSKDIELIFFHLHTKIQKKMSST